MGDGSVLFRARVVLFVYFILLLVAAAFGALRRRVVKQSLPSLLCCSVYKHANEPLAVARPRKTE